jgi:hypothetical protein
MLVAVSVGVAVAIGLGNSLAPGSLVNPNAAQM